MDLISCHTKVSSKRCIRSTILILILLCKEREARDHPGRQLFESLSRERLGMGNSRMLYLLDKSRPRYYFVVTTGIKLGQSLLCTLAVTGCPKKLPFWILLRTPPLDILVVLGGPMLISGLKKCPVVQFSGLTGPNRS